MNAKRNILQKYVIKNIGIMILDYSSFSGMLAYTEKNNNDSDVLYASANKNSIIIQREFTIELYELDVNACVIKTYYSAALNIKKIFNCALVTIHKILMCSNIIIYGRLIGGIHNKSKIFILSFNINELKNGNIVHYKHVLLDYCIIGDTPLGAAQTSDTTNNIICYYDEKIDIYNINTLEKMFVLDYRPHRGSKRPLGPCRLYVTKSNIQPRRIQFVNDYIIIFFDYCVCVYELINNECVFTSCIHAEQIEYDHKI
jgi:hypothetical protein